MENEIFYNHPFGSLYLDCVFTDFKFSKCSGKMVQFPFICRKQGHSSLLRQKVINKVVKWYFHQRWKMRFDIKLGVLCRTDFGQYLGVLITRKLYFFFKKVIRVLQMFFTFLLNNLKFNRKTLRKKKISTYVFVI